MRSTFLAGSWYPSTATECRAAIQRHAAEAALRQGSWQGAMVPHAGWRYCGDVLGATFASLAWGREDTDLVVVFGSHRAPTGPSTIFCDDAWDTPLGSLSVPTALARQLREELDLQDEPSVPAHPDNGVEILLPWVRYFFPRSQLLMLGVAAAPIGLVMGRHVAQRCAGWRTLFLGSTDLTHYGPRYHFEPHGSGPAAVRWVREVNDRAFVNAICRRDGAAALAHARRSMSACCPGAAAAALAASADRGIVPQEVAHVLSCDMSPDTSFVGYAGVLF